MRTPLCYVQQTNFDSVIGIGQGLDKVATVAITNPGLGYVAGDILTLVHGSAVNSKWWATAQVRVLAVDGNGRLLRVQLINPGCYTADPDLANVPTGGSGSGATLTITITANVPPWKADSAEITVTGADVRMRQDGGTPTTTTGDLLRAIAAAPTQETAPYLITGSLAAVKLIDAGGGNAAIANISFFSNGGGNSSANQIST